MKQGRHLSMARPAELSGAAAAEGTEGAGAAGPAPDDHLVSLVAPGTLEAEQYRVLRHVLERRRREASVSVVAVSSPAAGEGKTTTAINLAGALAQGRDTRVLLVDADLRLPSVTAQLGLPASLPGLVDLIADGGLTLGDVVRALPRYNLSILPSGRITRAPYEILKSPRLAEALGEARELYDYVLVDSPPLVPLPDGRVLARSVDGFLLVVAAHRTQRRLVAEALDLLDPQQLIGLVFNGDDRPLSSYYGYYGAYMQALEDAGRAGRGRPDRPEREAPWR